MFDGFFQKHEVQTTVSISSTIFQRSINDVLKQHIVHFFAGVEIFCYRHVKVV